jgi:uncharacterized protein DUF3891
MLISRRNGELYLVDQLEHARLCGDLVSHWGNERFAAPVPRERVRLGAAMHDEGWREADETPLFNAEAGRPLHFLEIAMQEHVPLYGRGVDRAFAADPYAGLMVSMHWTGLYRGRWGMQAGKIEFADEALQEEAVGREERRWIEVKRDLVTDTRRSDFEQHLWHHYDLLQAWDLLSLYVCLIDLSPADEVAARPVPATLKSIDPEPGPRTIGSVPVAVAGERVELVLRAVEPGVVTLDPYPFDADDMAWSVAARVIPDRRYESQADAAATLQRAPTATISCRMRRA